MTSAQFSLYPPPLFRVHDSVERPMPRMSSKTGLAPVSGVDTAASVAASVPALDLETRKKKHVCPTCSRGFTTSGHLSRHQRVHTGERNHACPFPGCNTRCSRQDNLQQHYRVHLSARSRNISTSAARQAMARRQSEANGVINTGSLTPPPMPPDLDRGSPPAPATIAYRQQQYHSGNRSPDSPPHPAAVAAALSGPGALQPINTSIPPYPSYLPRQEHAVPPRTQSSSWQASPSYLGERGRSEYNDQPLSPESVSSSLSQSPVAHLHAEAPPRSAHPPPPPHPHSHVRQISTSSSGSMQDGSGSDVSGPTFMEPAFDPGATTSHYQSLPNPAYLHHHHHASSTRGQSPPPILPPIFTNSRNSIGGAHMQNGGSPHYSGAHGNA